VRLDCKNIAIDNISHDHHNLDHHFTCEQVMLDMDSKEFVESTLRTVLPQIVIDLRRDVLLSIARTCGVKPSQLVLRYLHHLLAVLLTETQESLEWDNLMAAIDFIKEVQYASSLNPTLACPSSFSPLAVQKHAPFNVPSSPVDGRDAVAGYCRSCGALCLCHHQRSPWHDGAGSHA
jgi:hypothetical protein